MFTDFSFSGLIAGFVFSVIGWSVFKRGRQTLNMPLVYLGIAMLTYSYVVPGAIWPWIVGILLSAGVYFYWQ